MRITHAVSDAMKVLEQRVEMVQQAFLNTGISVSPNGTEDHHIRIQNMPVDLINFNRWETAQPIEIKSEEVVNLTLDDKEVDDSGDSLALSSCTKDQLKQLCKARKLAVSGNKPDLLN